MLFRLYQAVPFFGKDLVEFLWGGFSVNYPTIQRFFALHYLLPFVLAALTIMHLMALHTHGSTSPLGITGNVDRVGMHPYYVFKDLITVFVFMLFFSLFVFFSPNYLGQLWPFWFILYFKLQCAICWKYLIYYNKTIYISGLFLIFI